MCGGSVIMITIIVIISYHCCLAGWHISSHLRLRLRAQHQTSEQFSSRNAQTVWFRTWLIALVQLDQRIPAS
ncbi:hypothetical protein M5D96_004130 [Drosophila gunungcola]|uniref:Uncharacterized protein n=1 Tax=Drosophila gunungcola TaxID=103775 RepID=A0A9P9YTI5_9MUSC|nr:hypothetical protein M5D96_004130 [Drosophila gunungcola]